MFWPSGEELVSRVWWFEVKLGVNTSNPDETEGEKEVQVGTRTLGVQVKLKHCRGCKSPNCHWG